MSTSVNPVIATNAPAAYDYDYVKEVGTGVYMGRPIRLVSMPADSVDYQSGRYLSGMYAVVTNALDMLDIETTELFDQS